MNNKGQVGFVASNYVKKQSLDNPQVGQFYFGGECLLHDFLVAYGTFDYNSGSGFTCVLSEKCFCLLSSFSCFHFLSPRLDSCIWELPSFFRKHFHCIDNTTTTEIIKFCTLFLYLLFTSQ